MRTKKEEELSQKEMIYFKDHPFIVKQKIKHSTYSIFGVHNI